MLPQPLHPSCFVPRRRKNTENSPTRATLPAELLLNSPEPGIQDFGGEKPLRLSARTDRILRITRVVDRLFLRETSDSDSDVT